MPEILRGAFHFVRDRLRTVGFDISYASRPSGEVPDKELYRPLFQPWLSAGAQDLLRATDLRSLVSLDRKYVLWQLASQCVRGLPGDVAECGVYRGGTAYLLATIMRASTGRTLHLFDTFAGMPKVNESLDLHKESDFDDTSLEDVKGYLAGFENVAFHPGLLPGTFAGLEDRTFSFVHIDLDIHDAIRDATAFFYDRVPRGGIILYDDYGFPSCPGARKAVDDFFAGRIEMPLVLASGQCLVVKL